MGRGEEIRKNIICCKYHSQLKWNVDGICWVTVATGALSSSCDKRKRGAVRPYHGKVVTLLQMSNGMERTMDEILGHNHDDESESYSFAMFSLSFKRRLHSTNGSFELSDTGLSIRKEALLAL